MYIVYVLKVIINYNFKTEPFVEKINKLKYFKSINLSIKTMRKTTIKNL